MQSEYGRRAALENLARKGNGQSVDWINIADARALTEAGLAERARQGSRITAAGMAMRAADPSSPTAI